MKMAFSLPMLFGLALGSSPNCSGAANDADASALPNGECTSVMSPSPGQKLPRENVLLQLQHTTKIRTENNLTAEQASMQPCTNGLIRRRRRIDGMCACRRRSSSEYLPQGWSCSGDVIMQTDTEPTEGAASTTTTSTLAACLCVFDIDRTLTGKQNDIESCKRNKIVSDVDDDAYGGRQMHPRGKLTLSALANEGISKTFCGTCHLGIVSAGDGGGRDSAERAYLVEHVFGWDINSKYASWTPGDNVNSPLVYHMENKKKQLAVQGIVKFYAEDGIAIPAEKVFFFGDRTENIAPFAELGYNSREISCAKRDGPKIGYCGATPEEITDDIGNSLCEASPPTPASTPHSGCSDTNDWTNGFTSCRKERCGWHSCGSEDGCTASGWTCAAYQQRGWCSNGHKTAGSFAFGEGMNYPEKHCCVCGGGNIGTCVRADIQRRRRVSSCSCRRRSGSADLPPGKVCNEYKNIIVDA